MTKKSKTLINETVIRRWGKLANMPTLTENFLDTVSEEDEELEGEMDVAADELAAGEEDLGAAEEAEAAPGEQEAVESIVQAVVDAISAETGVEIEVEGGAADEAGMEDMPAEMDAPDDLESLADEGEDEGEVAAPAMRGPYNRKDIDEKKDTDAKDENLGIDVVDDEDLTEAVLKRVVERLLRAGRK